MKKELLLFSTLMWLMACPTPPENVPGSMAGGPQNGPQTPQGGPPPQGGPQQGSSGPDGQPMDPNAPQGAVGAPGPNQENGGQPMDPNAPQGAAGAPGPNQENGGQPMDPNAPQGAAGAPGPNQENGGQPMDPNGQNGAPNAQQGEGGQDGQRAMSNDDPNSPGYVPETPPEGTPLPIDDSKSEVGEPNHPGAEKPDIEGGTDQQPKPEAAPDPNKPPEGGIVTDSLLIIVKRIPSEPAKPQKSQNELANEKSVSFSGKVTCGGCTDPLLLRAVRFIGPNAEPTDDDLITQKSVSEGSFSILIPKGDDSIALELLVDSDNTESPSVGERFAVIEMGGQLIPSSNKRGLSLDATDRKPFEQAPIPNGSPEQ